MVTEGDKRPMKSLALSLFGVLLFLAPSLTLAMIPAAATSHEEEDHHHRADSLDITFFSSPRFPVVGEEAEFTFRVSHDGAPEEGRRVMLMVAEAEEVGGHAHHAEAADTGGAESIVEVAAIEMAPGVYVARYTFKKGGSYEVAPRLGDDEAELSFVLLHASLAHLLLDEGNIDEAREQVEHLVALATGLEREQGQEILDALRTGDTETASLLLAELSGAEANHHD